VVSMFFVQFLCNDLLWSECVLCSFAMIYCGLNVFCAVFAMLNCCLNVFCTVFVMV
jgi:hypothetical protein